MKHIIASLAVATLVPSLAAVASAEPMAPAMTSMVQSHDRAAIVGLGKAPSKPAPVDESGIDRTFHPDYSHALSAQQLTAAWNAEVDRIMETPVLGGG